MLRPQQTPSVVRSRRQKLPIFDPDETAWLTSFGVHLMLLVVLALLTFSIAQEHDELQISYGILEVPEEPQLVSLEFLSSDSPLLKIGEHSLTRGTSARSLGLDNEMHSQVSNELDLLIDHRQAPVVEGDPFTSLRPIKDKHSLLNS